MNKSKKAAAEQQIESLLEQMTLPEKIGMIHGDGLFCTKGVARLGILPLIMSDGPMGVRNEFMQSSWIPIGHSDDYVSYLPCGSALAATWNRELVRQTGRVLGAEARGRGKDVILAPSMNIKRSPLCGRNFEYLSEDPYLTGEIAVPLIQGIQENDVAACIKHFALNNQETERLQIDVQVTDEALDELYLPAFKKAVKTGEAYSVMGAYNRVRGEHCCESKLLLNEILRKQWNYDGMVVSDWGAVHQTKAAAESGLDIEMSVTDNFDQYCLAEPLKNAVEQGEIEESLVDEKVRNILRLMSRLHMLPEPDQKAGAMTRRKSGCYNTRQHQKTALDAARESLVLLKNEEHLLPLDSQSVKELLVIGDNAVRIHSNGGGSAEIKALYEISPLMGLKKMLGGNVRITYVPGYYVDDAPLDETKVNWQADSLAAALSDPESAKRQPDGLQLREEYKAQAVELAGRFEQVIFIGGLNHQHDLEGYDKPDIRLPYHQDEVLREVLAVNPNTVVVMLAGAPVAMGDWLGAAKALVWGWYGGMEGGTALAEVLFGQVNPSGRLPESFPFSHEDCPAHCLGEFPGDRQVRYQEGLMVGYRYYDTVGTGLQFPFGHGLSYTQFEYTDMTVARQGSSLQVRAGIKNTGSRTGQEVVQLYVGRVAAGPGYPKKELKGFEKISLSPGECGQVILLINMEELARYIDTAGTAAAESGEYLICLGKSVTEIVMQQTVSI